MSNWLVEYWKVKNKISGSHAQMSENIRWEKPDPKMISRRYFNNHKSASDFAQSMFDRGDHFATIIKDG